MQSTTPPEISLDDPQLLTLDEAVDAQYLFTGHGRPVTRMTIRRWAFQGIAGLQIPTRKQRIGSTFRVVTTPAALRWFDEQLAMRRHPHLADRIASAK